MPIGAEWQALLDGAVSVEHPRLLAAALCAAALLVAWALARGPLLLVVPRTAPSGERAWRALLRRLRPDGAWLLSVALRGGTLALLAVALAAPVGLVPENPAGGAGVDLVIALDASGSMKALDAYLDGARVTRLELARRVVAEFARGRGGDRLGLVVFGEHAFTQCPLTVDHRLVLEAIERVEIGVAGDATAIGEAIGLGTRRLVVPGAPPDGRRILVLITDGRHNSGQLAPETAAEIAKLHGVRIHAVGIGTTGPVPFAQEGPGEPLRFERVDLDRETLRAVAEITGGGFFHAEHPEDLEHVAAAIDRLEVRPHAGEPRVRRAALAPYLLAAALACVLLEALTAHGLLRRLP
jgi:Ca-activated chloride channel family protein